MAQAFAELAQANARLTAPQETTEAQLQLTSRKVDALSKSTKRMACGSCRSFTCSIPTSAAYNRLVCGARRALYFLEPMLIELGLGTSAGERDRLASDEPNASLPSPT